MKSMKITLSDDRALEYAEHGDPAGYPVIYCHGSQSSRLEMHYDMAFAADHGLRIITVDRPGHGLSDLNPTGSILSFADDVGQLMAAIDVHDFAVVGMSAGCPFALGIAHLHADKVSKVGIISGFAPYTSESREHLSKDVRVMLGLARSAPWLLKAMLKTQAAGLHKNPDKALRGFLKIMSAPDQAVLQNPQVMDVIGKMFTEAFRNGSDGVAYEISHLLVRDWGFDLADVSVPTTFWQGELDNNVPLQWAQSMQHKIPHASLVRYPDEGHLIIFTHAEEIFTSMKPGT